MYSVWFDNLIHLCAEHFGHDDEQTYSHTYCLRGCENETIQDSATLDEKYRFYTKDEHDEHIGKKEKHMTM